MIKLCIYIGALVVIFGVLAFCKFLGKLSREEEQRDRDFIIGGPLFVHLENTCVCCGVIIPEGHQVCLKCIKKVEDR